MSIFEEVKNQVSAKQVAENYGLKIGRKDMACCPFHDDRHPSMKIDATHYYCFGCGAKGDAIGYVAELFNLSQLDAAKKIASDFNLSIEEKQSISDEERKRLMLIQSQKDYQQRVKKKFYEWVDATIDLLKDAEADIKEAREFFIGKEPGVLFMSNGFAYMLHQETTIAYWLDILCGESEEDKLALFFTDREGVNRVAANIKRSGDEILGRTGKRAG